MRDIKIVLLVLLLINLFSCKKESYEILHQYDSEVIKLINDKQYEEALSLCNKMEKINPDYLIIYLIRGNIYKDLGQFENAELEYTKIIKKNEHLNLLLPRQMIGSFVGRSLSRMHLRKYDLAKSDAKKAISIFENDFKPYYLLANIYYENREYENLINLLESMINKFPNEYKTYFMRAAINYLLQDYEQAITDCNYVINKSTDEAKYMYYIRGLSNIALKKYKQALPDIIKVQEIFPEKKLLSYSITYVYYKLGDIKKAKQNFIIASEYVTEENTNVMIDLTHEFTEKKETKKVFQEISKMLGEDRQ